MDDVALGLRTSFGWTALVATALFAHSPLTHAAFPDARNPPPAGWQGPVFKLSQNYPRTLPGISNPPWLRFDFTDPTQAPHYMAAVLNYCMQGNTANNFADVSRNSVRKWYHAPWLHDGPAGREFIHGMTRERPSRAGELGPLQTSTDIQNWAVGFYNGRGGYTLGRVWANEQNPDPSKATFPLHTVSCKLIFTSAALAEVPYLEGSLEWEADINRASNADSRPKLRLLQLDVAVRDARANPTTGWVFGTFQYEKQASTSADWWRHMVPVGLMWGNDAPRVLISQPPREQWINPNRGQQLHLGLRGLLNGPIDNPRASCVACHGLAQMNKVSDPNPTLPRVPTANASASTLQRYLRNIGAGEPYSADYTSLDYSLQLQVGLANFFESQGAAPVGAADTAEAASRTVRPIRAIHRDDE
ncbi:MAG: hypothetical protein ACJ8MR_13825 [Povalibacter sp.]